MRFILSIVVVIAMSLFIRSFVVQAYKIPAGSMRPTLLVGDHILVDKNPFTRHELRRGDIIVFKFPEDPRKDFVKRVIGLPGETIQMTNGIVSIDGQPLEEDYVRRDPSIPDEKVHELAPYTVPDNHLFVHGDNRNFSYDRRFWGPVPIEDIKGKVWRIYWSYDRECDQTRRERVWAQVH